ncbi:TRAP transporter substrate-binding protein [Desulfovibrio ferrophilus]|uniref:TRAP dicarboxylate transporter, DctP subunit n=1 Tax=Desulfovibrio ferrophilus TaxID=241368 RepID=A0A2Z6B112_9BACT|nr:TRAP transporter substrate-binding protein [Desulfovibrio ferrophilus]BBD09164.1 TRAP dicarboxylate transporter, DctP subunit [Desulfovibrio ferrophilus]
MKQGIRRILLFVFAVTLLAVPGMAQAKTVLKLGHLAPIDHPYHAGAMLLSGMVAKKSHGDMEIKVFPANQLGKQRELVEGAQLGTVDMVLTSDVLLSSFEETMGVLNMPFLFRDIEHVGKVLDGPVGQELSANLAKKGLVVLGYWENGFRHITNSKHPINTPADLKGLKVRTPSGYIFIESFKDFGASPTPMAFGELYSALQLGTVDGQENPVAHVVTQKFYEVQKYLSLTGHIHVSEPLVMSKVIYDSLSPEQQKILHESAAEIAVWSRAKVAEEASEKLEFLKTKMKVNTAQRKTFAAASEALYEHYEGKFGALIKEIKSAI